MQDDFPAHVPDPDRSCPTNPLPDEPDTMDDLLRAAFGKPRGTARSADLPSVVTRLRKTVGQIDSVCLTGADSFSSDESSPVVLPSIPHRSIDRYQLFGEIAHGGMGTVYLARDLDLGRDLAIKVLNDEHVGDGPMTQRFVEESQIAGQLEHPGIVPVHELGLVDENKPYLAMKLIRGETLASLLRKRKDLEQDRTRFVAIFEDICRPIAYAHSRRVVHRDLKPANIMVGRLGEVQVTDWGLAKVLGTGAGSSLASAAQRSAEPQVQTCRSGSSAGASLSGSLIGTPAYMSPEQARGEVERIDERSDVFGLGAILCEILTGFPPNHGGSKAEQIRRAAEAKFDDTYHRLDKCGADPALVAIAKHCLAVRPDERPRDAAEVADAIREYRESIDRRARDLEIRVAQSRSRRRWLSVLACVLCLAAVGVWRVALTRHEKREQATMLAAQAISEARGRRSAAEAADVDDEASWNAALQAARAIDSLLTSDVDEAVRNDARELVTDVESRFVQARMLSRLQKLRNDHVESFSDFDVGENFADAFTEYFGIDFESLARGEAVRRCRQSPIAEELALALDEWSIIRHINGEDWRSLAAISVATSAASWRPMLHAELARDDFDLRVTDVTPFLDEEVPNGIRSLVAFDLRMSEVPASTRGTSASTEEERQRWIQLADDYASAIETLLRRAIELEPDSYRINAQLAQCLTWRIPDHPEATQFVRAACALRPEVSRSWMLLAENYRVKGNLGGALDAHLRSLALGGNRQIAFPAIREIIASSQLLPHRLLVRVTDAVENRYPEDSERTPSIHDVLDVAWQKLDRLSSDQSLRLLEAHVARTQRREPEGLALLAKIQFARGLTVEAVRNLEEAQTLLGNVNWRSEELAAYRASRQPTIASFASLDAAWETAAEPKQLPADSVDPARNSDLAAAYQAYWQGRTAEHEGRSAEAVDLFRAAQRCEDSSFRPTLRLATAFAASGRMDEAADVLAARINAVSLAPARLWRHWATTSFAAGHTPEQLLNSFPKTSARVSRSNDSAIHLTELTYEEDLHCLLTELARDGKVRINGGGRDYVDPNGRLWMRDAFFTGGYIFLNSVDAAGRRISGTELDPLYQTERWGGFRYHIPLPSGQYRVVLHFAEIYDTYRRNEESRIFDVLIEDQLAREGLNIHAAVGFAAALTFEQIVDVSDGALNIGFQHRAGTPKISAIEIEHRDR